jgi:indolepyruvate ferredoxin oxidoreductase alpha subunit
MTRRAFDMSEETGLPVMLRLVTRLSHSRAAVIPREPRQENQIAYGSGKDWTLLPMNARRRFKVLLEKQAELQRLSDASDFNRLELQKANRETGVIASGIAYNYIKENFKDLEDPPSVLKVSTYPVPRALVARLLEHVETVIVAEEGYPFIESNLVGLFGISGKQIRGRLTGDLPASGELSPEAVRPALGLEPGRPRTLEGLRLPGRPPQLCKGCPHADTYKALKLALQGYEKANVFSDIGCYTLGALPPYQAISTCVCMGASVSMAKGGAEAGVYPSIAVIGDSTFGHSGLTPLLDAAATNTDMTVLILDNSIVAMTGGQPSFASGQRLLRMIQGVGVAKEHMRVIEPLPKNLEANAAIIRQELDYRGLSVIVAARACIQEARNRKRSK